MLRVFRQFCLFLVLLSGLALGKAFDCGEAYEAILEKSVFATTLDKLPPERREFVFQTLTPVFGRRLFESAPGVFRQVEITPNGFTIRGYGDRSRDVNFRWVSRIEKPYARVEPSNGSRTILIPEGFNFALLPNGGQDFFYRALKGHSLNPFVPSKNGVEQRIALGEPDIILKEVQEEASKALTGSLARGDEAVMFVGPTGVGKTKVLEKTLGHLVGETKKAIATHKAGDPEPGKIHIVFAKSNDLVGQLEGNIRKMEFADDVEIFRWGGTKTREELAAEKLRPTPKTIEELTEYAKKSKKPIVVVTTDRSLTMKSGAHIDREDTPTLEFDDSKVQLFRDNVRSLVIDEAHNAGAPQTVGFMDKMRGISRTPDGKIYNQVKDPKRPFQVAAFTATPTRTDMHLIDDVFDGNAFWGYRDNADDFLAHGGQSQRTIKDVVEQMESAVEKGESHPVKTLFIDPTRFNTSEDEPFFIQRVPGQRGSPFEINPKQYEAFFNTMAPVMNRHQHMFFACSTIDEAISLKNYFENHQPPLLAPDGKPHRFAFAHSDKKTMTDAQKKRIMDDFRDGKHTVLFNVGLLDEGIDIPSLSAYIDTNRKTNPRDLIQRIGRVVRPHEGKVEDSEVISFQQINNVDQATALAWLDGMNLRDWSAADTGGGGGGGGGHGPKTPGPEEMAPNVFWTHEDLVRRKNEFFADRVTAKVQTQFDEIAAWVKEIGKDGVLNPFTSMPPARRKMFDNLYRMANGDGKESESFLYLVQQSPDEIRKPIEAYLQKLRERQEIARSAPELARWARNHESEYAVDGTAEAKHMGNAVRSRMNDPIFLTEYTGAKNPTKDAEEVRQRFEQRLAKPGQALEDLDNFLQHYRRDPSATARGYEQKLAQTIDKFTDPKSMPGDEFEKLLAAHLEDNVGLQVELLSRREQKEIKAKKPDKPLPREIVVSQYPDDYFMRKPAVVNSLLTRLRAQTAGDPQGTDYRLQAQRDMIAKLEGLKKMETEEAEARKTGDADSLDLITMERDDTYKYLSNVPRLAKLAGIPESKEATLVLSGKPQAIDQLTEFYRKLSKQLGYKEPVITQSGTTTSVKFTAGPNARLPPSQAVAFEEGEHLLQYRFDGRVHSNPVTVTRATGTGSPQGTTPTTVRKYRFQDNSVTDKPGDKAKEQPISLGADQADSWERAIGARIIDSLQ